MTDTTHAPQLITITTNSSDTSVVPVSDLTLTACDLLKSACNLNVASGSPGLSTITITADDAIATFQQTFDVTVTNPPSPSVSPAAHLLGLFEG